MVWLWYRAKRGKTYIKTITPSIKALITGCPLKLVFGKKDDYLCVGVRIIDIPDSPLFISKVQYKSEEHNALIKILKEGMFQISLINEMDKLVAWGEIKISKEKAIEVLDLIKEKDSLYFGPYTKEVEYAHDCFCVSVEDTYKYKFPSAHTIPVIELETTTEKWTTIKSCFYGNQNQYSFIIDDKDEGRTFEQEIASALISVFPKTLYKNPNFKEGNKLQELTDIFTYYEKRSFLIEAKDLSVIDAGYERYKTRRISNIQKQVKKAIGQLTGAAKKFLQGNELYTVDNEKINVDRGVRPHCIVLITEFMHEGNWNEVEKLLFNAIEETGAFFHIMDLREFIELLKASSGIPEIIDYNLMQRCEWQMKSHSIHIKGK